MSLLWRKKKQTSDCLVQSLGGVFYVVSVEDNFTQKVNILKTVNNSYLLGFIFYKSDHE